MNPIRSISFSAVSAVAAALLVSCASVSQGQTSKSSSLESPNAPIASGTAFYGEVIIRSANNLSSASAVTNLVNYAKANGITTLSVAAKQDEDDEYPSGTVFYNSSIATNAFGNWDGFGDLVTKAHAAGIKVRAWIPQFHDQVAYKKNSSWAMMALVNGKVVSYTGNGSTDYFVNPLNSSVQAYERSIIKEVVTKYAVDSVMLDWIRFDNWNMDLSSTTQSAFQAVYGYNPTTIDFTTDNTKRTQWQDWRTTQLATYIAAVRSDIKAIRSTTTLGVYVLPPAPTTTSDFAEVGQDPAKFKGSIDLISPMCYYTDWGYTYSWVYNTCIKNTYNKVGSGVVIIPTLDISYSKSTYTKINAGIRSNFSAINTLSYFGYGTWTNADLANINVWRKL